MGSGVLIDAQFKLVLTCQHIVQDEPRAVIFFPVSHNGKEIGDPQHYLDEYESKGKLGCKAKVVYTVTGKDLALLQLEDALPEGVLAVQVSPETAQGGQGVLSIGVSGVHLQKNRAVGVLWRNAPGTVRRAPQRETFKTRADQLIDASIVETTSETNPEDSGGPVVNERGELIAVVSVFVVGERSVTKNIDASEADVMVRTFIKKEYGKEWLAGPLQPGVRQAPDVTALLQRLTDPNPQTRLRSIRKLGELAVEAKSAIPRLVPLLKDSDPDISRAVHVALDLIGTPTKFDLDVLYQALKDKHDGTRVYAARMLASDKEMITRDGFPSVLVAADHDKPDVQENAVLALGNYVNGWRDSLPTLMKLRRSDETDRKVKQNVRKATQNLTNAMTAQDVPEYVRFFKQLLDDRKASVRQLAAEVLTYYISQDYRDLLPILLTVLKDEDEDVRRETLTALTEPKKLNAVPKENVSALLEALRDEHREIRQHAYLAIGKFLPDERRAMPHLIAALIDKDPKVRDYAVADVHKFGLDAQEAVPALLAALRIPDTSTTSRRLIVETLALVGQHPQMVVALLVALEDKDADIGKRAENALVKLKVKQEDVPALIEGLQNQRSEFVRANAADALGRIGPEAAAAVPALIIAAKDKELPVRIRAIRTLGLIGPEARSCVKVLAEILRERLPDAPGTAALRSQTGPGIDAVEIGKRTLKSAVWIVVRTSGGASLGSGSLIDLPQRLVLTNHHVVSSGGDVRVFFPSYDQNHELITATSTYLQQESKLGLQGKVLDTDPARDLALIALDQLPEGVLHLPLASRSPQPNEHLYSIGASRALDGALWRSITGQVSLVRDNEFDYPTGQHVRARLVETTSPTNPGDSGGPMVNDRGEQVAVVSGRQIDQQLVGWGIDITEVHAFLNAVSQRRGLNLTTSTHSSREPLTGSVSELRQNVVTALSRMGPDAKDAVPVLRAGLGDKDGTLRNIAIAALGEIGPNAKQALDDLVQELQKVDGRVEVVDTLAKIGSDADSVDRLINKLSYPQKEIRLGVVQALGKIGPPARKAKIELSRISKGDKNKEVRAAAQDALQRVQAKP
ncbi:MAG TPA: HEAT repeat domain-containing protein [Gemmataceae bacterium]|nr:HEAT repeat domain-containing protein [Gemmataceae bacterium]